MEVTKITVGPISENCFIVKVSAEKAVIIDPGAEGKELSAGLKS